MVRAIGMYYLAQVHTEGNPTNPTGDVPWGFLPIALRGPDDIWEVAPNSKPIKSDRAIAYHPGNWVLVTTNDRNEITQVEDAKSWILEIIQNYLSPGVTPEFLRQETERAEQWRQSLTLRSQEVDRRALELEARREQLQALEEELKREKQELEEPETPETPNEAS